MTSPTPQTKLVEIVLTAHREMTYREVVEVPASISPAELAALAQARQAEVDPSQYDTDDARILPTSATASTYEMKATSDARISGRLIDGTTVRPLLKTERTFAISEGWEHDFGAYRVETRWILDIATESIIHADMSRGDTWIPLSSEDVADLEASVLENIDSAGLDAFGFQITSTQPAWSSHMTTRAATASTEPPASKSMITLSVNHNTSTEALPGIIRKIIDVGIADAAASSDDPDIDNADAEIAAGLRIEVAQTVDESSLYALQQKIDSLQAHLSLSGAMDSDSDRTPRLVYEVQASLATLLGQPDVAANWEAAIARLSSDENVERPRG